MLVGCNDNGPPHPSRQFERISYINSLTPEKTKELLMACSSEEWCYAIIERQMQYEQYINRGTK